MDIWIKWTKLVALAPLVLGFEFATASSATIGATYAIIEPDAMAEIEMRAAQIDWVKELTKRAPETFSALQPEPLPYAVEDRVRHHIPWYISEFDVPDKDGRILYPKGYRFNPLDHIRLPQRLVVLSSRQLDWLISVVQPFDMLIITDGHVHKVMERLSTPVFILDRQIKERLDLHVVPTIVDQVGNTLRLQEFKVPLDVT